jgi:EAL domain-containing protein (putative c-di-GMP-specific phosphodiesterase class I)/GGDEF domain-containing protein/DNA-binding response OmpR family regulator
MESGRGSQAIGEIVQAATMARNENGDAALTDDSASADEPLFILSFRHRDELTAAAVRGGWRPIAARRPAGAERRFIASGAAVAVVDARGAFDEGLGAVRLLADPVEANAASLIVLVSRNDVARLAEVHAAGATHYLASPFGEGELLHALRFAARHAERAGGGAISRPAMHRSEALSWTWREGAMELSAALAERLGTGSERVTARQAYRLLPAVDRPAGRAARRRLKAGYGSTAFSHAMPDGGRVAHHLTARDGLVSGLVEPLEGGDALPLHRDPLTGLSDGVAARRRLAAMLVEGEAPGVLLVGLSRLQAVNSVYGRAGGDVLIQAAARRIEAAAGEAGAGAWVARLAGTEFLVAVPHADADALLRLGGAIMAAVERRFVAAPDLFLVAADIGGAAGDAEGAGGLLRRASAALAEAREAPGSAVRIDAGEEAGPPLAQRLAAEVRQAMAAGQIDLLFQPQLCIAEQRIDGVEALARWNHPELGELGADQLFAAADRANLAGPLSALIQHRALEVAAAWPAALSAMRLSINVTAGDLAKPGFAGDLLALIARSGFAAERVTAEVTEEGLIDDLGAAASALAELRRGGVRIAVDDFGTGYSSLAYLKALPLDYLKLDRRLTQDITGSARDRVVVRGVIDMARSLGLGVIAEGVETEEQLALLAAEGCTLYQGFLCSKPVGVEELTDLANRSSART